MIKKIMQCLLAGAFFLLSPAFFFAQEVIYDTPEAEVSITGGSTLHDWKLSVSDVAGFPTTIQVDEEQSISIETFGFNVGVKSMDGGRGAAMNKKVYNALKADSHPRVSFNQTEIWKAEGSQNLVSVGEVSIAGMTLSDTVMVAVAFQEDQLVFSGAHPMKLSSFNIDPPSAMFGQIQTKDDIEVHFRFIYKRKQ